jgi:hypothetical protein
MARITFQVVHHWSLYPNGALCVNPVTCRPCLLFYSCANVYGFARRHATVIIPI